MKKNIKKDIEINKYSELFLFLSIVFVVCLLLSNIMASKIIKFGMFSITAGALVFPISFIINDVFSEVYGYNKTKRIIIFGFLMNLFMVLMLSLTIILPSPTWFKNSDAFELILGSTPRNCLASLTAYLFGSLVNSKILIKLKKRKNNKFGVRAIISTLFGELSDSIIFVIIAFLGKMTMNQIITMILTQVILKTLYEVVCLPFTTTIVKTVKKYENIEGK